MFFTNHEQGCIRIGTGGTVLAGSEFPGRAGHRYGDKPEKRPGHSSIHSEFAREVTVTFPLMRDNSKVADSSDFSGRDCVIPKTG